MERSAQGKRKIKPQLVIDINESNPEGNVFKRKSSQKNQVQIKPPLSAKNQHELKNIFNFSQSNILKWNKHQNKLKALERLQSQKRDLMKSLQILKQGAVSAIVQKQEQIKKLKQQIYTQSQKKQQNDYQKQLQQKEFYQQQLQGQVEQLRKQLRMERVRYESQLYQKEQLINNLYNELNYSYGKIQNLENNDLYMSQRIRAMEWQNSNLLKQLEVSTNSLNLSNISVPTANINISSTFSEGNFILEQNNIIPGDLSVASTIPKKYSENILFEDEDHLSNSYYSQRIYIIETKHQQQIEKLTEYYQEKISRLKKIYQKGSQPKDYSCKSQKSQNLDQEDANLRQRTDSLGKKSKTLSKNNSMQLLKLDGKMYSIDERNQQDQEGTPRNYFSLKDQIIESKLQDSKTLLHTHFSNDDIISQFTAKHFQYPFSQAKLFQRTNTVGTLNVQRQEGLNSNQNLLERKMSKDSQSEVDVLINQSDQKSNTSRKSIKKDLMLFCMGIVTGGTLYGVGTKLFQ